MPFIQNTPQQKSEDRKMATEEARSRFGRALAKARTVAGKQQRHLALLLGHSQAYVGQVEAGEKELRHSEVFEVEQFLNVEPGSLSRHLGYLPVGAKQHRLTVVAAIEQDSSLSDEAQEALLAMYRLVSIPRGRRRET